MPVRSRPLRIADAITQQSVVEQRELEEVYDQPDIVKTINAERLRWAGHVKRQKKKQ